MRLTGRGMIVVLAWALAPAACSSEPADEVLMVSGQRFSPSRLTVGAGTTVTFRNDAEDSHTVTGESGIAPAEYFASGGFEDEASARRDVGAGLIGPGETFEVTFDEAGTYPYFCIPHAAQGMTGEIVVVIEVEPLDGRSSR